ncbi:MAG TPA: alpha/beta fold hydrolase [Candidatus Nitrosocosmicus sp.]|nr:alpha/beta fold hydrolase [Candidatus Nitrosocosmicus sp.]
MNPLLIPFELFTTTFNVLSSGFKISTSYSLAYLVSYLDSLKSYRKEDSPKSLAGYWFLPFNELYDLWIKTSDTDIGEKVHSDSFSSSLRTYVNSQVKMRKLLRDMGYPIQYYEDLQELFAKSWNTYYTKRKDMSLTDFVVEYNKKNVRLLHFISKEKSSDMENQNPLLIVYAPINQFHIMDIYPERSVVKSLLSKGIDVYLLDWGYPLSDDNNLSLYDYVQYVSEAVKYIQQKPKLDIQSAHMSQQYSESNIVNPPEKPKKEGGNDISGSRNEKISLLGYCWGGIIAISYASWYTDNLKNLTLLAVPVDSSKDKTTLANWTQSVDTDKIIEEFGHFSGKVLDIGFIMRNPIRFTGDKYLTMTKRINDKDFMKMFQAVEEWLYNTPNIPGGLFKDIVNGCYKNNGLVCNNMIVGGNRIDLTKINIPVLTVVAENDDLVSPESTIEINNHISSQTKEVIRFKGGHVGLCVSSSAHNRLWPQIAEWIKNT